MKRYAYMKIADPMVAWEVAIGRCCSADLMRRSGVLAVSLRQFSMFREVSLGGDDAKLRSEIALEQMRLVHAPSAVSRLGGLFMFESESDAVAITKRWDGRHFRKEFLTPIEIEPPQTTTLDSEWITTSFSRHRERDWMAAYWRGETYGESPLAECLCSGIGRVLSQDLRERAYRQTVKSFPLSRPILDRACLAFSLGFLHAAQIVAFLKSNQNGKPGAQGVNIINMRDFEKGSELVDAFARYQGPGIQAVAPDEDVALPDLRRYWFDVDHTRLNEVLRNC